MSAPPVVLILGAGPGIGAQTAAKFASQGYRVASAARSLRDGTNSQGHAEFHVDLSQPELVGQLFAKVKKEVGIPSVVLFNGIVSPTEDVAGTDTDQHIAAHFCLPTTPSRPSTWPTTTVT